MCRWLDYDNDRLGFLSAVISIGRPSLWSARMRSSPSLEDRIRQLESELSMARITILELTGPKFMKVLYPPSSLEEIGSVHMWFREMVEKVLDLSNVVTVDERFGGASYADCPLCGEGANNFYRRVSGFTYPEGLRRHLHGSHNSMQCKVSYAAHELAIDWRNRRDRRGR